MRRDIPRWQLQLFSQVPNGEQKEYKRFVEFGKLVDKVYLCK